ncbi:hypothetical protein HML84_17460 [Alcanivorax sp. IO_7]|nr:hypothetical protein HML84_17460 [Alcanivorax sp. IO_7]
MKVETFSDVLDWTRAVHRNLADCAAHCGAGSRHEKVRMLLDYVHEHETRLNRILESSQKDADPAALNSWAYEFFEKAPVRPTKPAPPTSRTRTPARSSTPCSPSTTRSSSFTVTWPAARRCPAPRR